MGTSEIAQAYLKYLGPKCSRSTYYERLRQGMSINEAIKPVTHEERYKKGKIRTSKFQEELEWYNQYQGEKINRCRFYQRLYQGWDKEVAIKIAPPPRVKVKFGPRKKPLYIKPVKKHIPVRDQDNKIIIRYSKDEAEVIKKEYVRVIASLEEEWRGTEDIIEAKEIMKQIESLQKEYEMFCNASS